MRLRVLDGSVPGGLTLQNHDNLQATMAEAICTVSAAVQRGRSDAQRKMLNKGFSEREEDNHWIR